MNPFVANFRDVGQSVNTYMGEKLMKTGRLYRGGKPDDCPDLEWIGSPKTIVNLRILQS